jgi:hypothetical protein
MSSSMVTLTLAKISRGHMANTITIFAIAEV